MPTCSQCSNTAVYEANSQPLCLGCAQRFQDILDRQLDAHIRDLNYIEAQWERMTGIPQPRYEVRRPAPVIAGNVTVNKIRISDSVVGAINTGQIDHLNVVVNAVRESGQAALAEKLAALSQAVVDTRELVVEAKNEALEHLAFLAAEAVRPEHQRQRSVGKIILNALEKIMTATGGLLKLWEAVRPLLHSLF